MQPAAHAERGNRCARMSTADTVAIPLVIGDLKLFEPKDNVPVYSGA
jgi:hypothetical protein